jgi:hypothetical protein
MHRRERDDNTNEVRRLNCIASRAALTIDLLSTRPVYPPTNHTPPMSVGGSLLRGDYSTKLQLCPRVCGGASLELWMLWICLVCLACFGAKCLLQASRVPHPAVGCRSAGRIRQTLVTVFDPPSFPVNSWLSVIWRYLVLGRFFFLSSSFVRRLLSSSKLQSLSSLRFEIS